jgi:hypothetical protein
MSTNPWLSLGTSPPFVADIDRAILDAEHVERYQLRCDVLPHAWIGNPATARGLILQLNPGFAETDVTEEATIPAYREIVRESLHLGDGAGFWVLDERLRETGASGWWRRRLRALVEAVGEDAVRRHLAVIEYFPYHSIGYHRPPRLPSQDFAFSLVTRAAAAGAVVVVMRQWESWCAAVPELISYERTFRNPHPRVGAVSPGNLGVDAFTALADRLRQGHE